MKAGERLAPRSVHLSGQQVQFGWDRDRAPLVTVPSGSTLTLHVPEASGGQVNKGSTYATIADLDFERVNPTCGPIYVEGATTGSALQVEILNIRTGTWGWTAQIPGFGLLADQFPDPWLRIWEFEEQQTRLTDGIRVRLHPMCGVIGVVPAEHGVLSVVPPRRVGGNMDIKQLGEGATLYLPVAVPGALLGIGDPHAAQGDGEVCGSAIETSAEVVVRVTVRKDLSIESPEFDVPGALERTSAAKAGYHATSGIAPDLITAARQSVERMIVYLGSRYRLEAQDAYALCSVAVDLRISEVVDAPNWVVSAFLPLDLFDPRL